MGGGALTASGDAREVRRVIWRTRYMTCVRVMYLHACMVWQVGIDAGDHVMYDKYAGSDAELAGKKYKVVDAKDCIAKWTTS